ALLWAAFQTSPSDIGGRGLEVVEVAATGPGAPHPLGAERTPAPGEVFVSPALGRLLESDRGRVYRLRFPGRIDGTLGRGVLHDPDELVAMVGVTPDRLTGATRITDWGAAQPAAEAPTSNTFNRRLVYLLAALGVLIPIAVFVGASTRIGATTRERRFAAMRLVGATPRQVALAAATEAAAAAVVGGLVGLALALLLRTRAADVAVAGYSTFPADLAPPLWQIGLVLIATPVLAAGAALGSMRRVAVTPLGVRRRQVPGGPSARRLIPLAVAWIELAVAVQMGDRLTEDGKLAALGVGFAGVILGIVIAGPWLVGALASAVAGGARGPGTLIAGRRLQASPATAFRAVGGAVLGVFAATAVLVYLPSHDRWIAAGNDVTTSVAPAPVDADVEVYRNGEPYARVHTLANRLAGLPGVRSVLPAADVPPGRVLFAGCAEAARVLHETLHCPARGVLVDRSTGPVRVGRAITIRGIRTTVGAGFAPNGVVSVIAPPGTVPAPPRPTVWMLASDGKLATAQTIRAAQTASGLMGFVETAAPDTVLTTAADPLRRQAELVVALMLSIAGCSLVVMMVEGVLERRRELAMLAAAGTRPGTLRSAAALEVLVPLAVASVASCVVGVLVTATLLRVRGIGLVVPWLALGELLAAAAVVGVLVLALGLPVLGRAIRADNLRTE
ncbi:MAG: FtsX-like permease family protein, partial [Gaiellales bacterium]